MDLNNTYQYINNQETNTNIKYTFPNDISSVNTINYAQPPKFIPNYLSDTNKNSDVISYSVPDDKINMLTTPQLKSRTLVINANFLLAGGSGTNQMVYSYDGIIWSPISSGNAIFTVKCNCILYNGILWVAGGGNGANNMAYSSDGLNWTVSTSGSAIFTTHCYTIAWNGSIWVAGGFGTSSIAYSSDGINWTSSASGNSLLTYCLAVIWSGTKWIAGGLSANRLITSDDGISWSASSSGNSVFTTQCLSLATSGSMIVAGGSGTNTLAYSYDGITWTGSTSGNTIFSSEVRAIAWSGSLWVAGSNTASGPPGNKLAYSSNGIDWTASTSGNSVLSTACFGVVWSGNTWVAGGYGTNRLAYSSDGINWTGSTSGNSVITSTCYAVASKYNAPTPVFWIDSSDLTTVLRDYNNNVYQILDKSASRNHLTQSTLANQPKYHNGSIVFNENQYLVGNNTLNINMSSMGIFIVAKQYNTSTLQGLVSGTTSSTVNDNTSPNSWSFNGTDGSTYQYAFNTASQSIKKTTSISSTLGFGVYEIKIYGGIGYLYYNGTLVNQTSLATLGTFTNVILGSRYLSSAYSNFLNGEIYEIIILGTGNYLSSSFKTYLSKKWLTSQISRTIPISNIYTWLDASSSSNFTLDINNNVLSWNDKNFVRNFTQSNASYYPVFDTNKVIFNNSYLTYTDTSGLDLNNFSVFAVFEEISHIDNSGLISAINSGSQTDTGVSNGFSILSPSTSNVQLKINNNSINYTGGALLTKQLYQFTVISGVGTLYINGVLQSTQNFGTLGTALQFVIGSRIISGAISTSTYLINAKIYELIILNTAVSYNQVSQLYSYLTEKWNVLVIYKTPSSSPDVWFDSTQNVTVSGSNVTGWTDLSSNAYSVTIGGTAPIRQTVNSLNGIYFNNSNMRITLNSMTGSNLSIYMVFSVSQTNATSNGRILSFKNGSVDTNNDVFNLNTNTNNGTIRYQSTSAYPITVLFTNTLYIFSMQINNNVVSIYLNNYLVTTFTNSVNYNYATLDIGSINTSAGTPFIGYMNELIMYKSNLAPDNNLGTLKYLANKWGINIQSSNVNEFIPRLSNTLYSAKLDTIFNATSYLTVSKDAVPNISDPSTITLNIPIPITLTLPNELTIGSDSIALTAIDKNTVYNVKQSAVTTTSVIILPVNQMNNDDYFAFVNNSGYTITIIRPGGGSTTIASDPEITRYFTYDNSSYTVTTSFSGLRCDLNKYDNLGNNNFTIYLHGWSKSLSYITKLYIFDSSDNLLAVTNPIYYGITYQADFSLVLSVGSYSIRVSDTSVYPGNIVSLTIPTPIVITTVNAVLDHYNDGSSTYTITLENYLSSSNPGITNLDVWISNKSDYSNSYYLLTSNTLSESNTATFTYNFYNGIYYITIKSGIVLNLPIVIPIVITTNSQMSFSLTNPIHTNTMGQFCVIAGFNTSGLVYINYSYNGIDIVNQDYSSVVTACWPYAVSYNGSRWVVGFGFSNNRFLMYSDDGVNWIPSANGPSIFNEYVKGVATNGTMWVAVGLGINQIAYSFDGITWIGLGSSYWDYWGSCVEWNGSMWLAGGFRSSVIYYSYDGVVWRSPITTISSLLEDCGRICWSGSKWFVCARTNGTVIKIIQSSDGLNWTSSTSASSLLIQNDGVTGLTVGNGYVAALLYDKPSTPIIYTTDSTNWSSITFADQPLLGGGTMNLGYNGLYFIALGGNPRNISYSSNLTNWTASNNPAYPRPSNVLDLPISFASLYTNYNQSYYGKIYVTLTNWTNGQNYSVMGGTSGSKYLAYSDNGITWTDSSTGNAIFSGGTVFGIGFNQTQWLAGGTSTNSRIAYSSDGSTWTNSTSGASAFTTNCKCFAWDGSKWIAGGSGTNQLASSTNGITWTGLGNSFFVTGCNCIAYNGSLWVAGGTSDTGAIIIYSSNGTSWSTGMTVANNILNTMCNCVAWNGSNLWVAGGQSNRHLSFSSDGITWSSAISGSTIFGTQCRSVAYGNGVWVAGGGTSVSLAYSIDGRNWTASTNGSTIMSDCYSVSWNNSYWLAVGNNGVIALSYDGINWINRSSTTISTPYSIVSRYNSAFATLPNPFTTAISTLYLKGYSTNSYTTELFSVNSATNTITNVNEIYKIAFTYQFDVTQDYYLKISDNTSGTGIFNYALTNYLPKITISGTITPTSGSKNTNNVFTVTLTNNEYYNLNNNTNTSNAYIFRSDTNNGLDTTYITTSTINISQQVSFTYNPGSSGTTQYFYICYKNSTFNSSYYTLINTGVTFS
jgi:hypothetical protein